MHTANEWGIPIELMKDKETLSGVIEFLKIYEKILAGKTVPSRKGFQNKFKYYILGYAQVQKTHICEKCSTPMVLEKTDDTGTVVAVHVKGKFSHPEKVTTGIFRNAKMGFNWLYFTCPKCGWGYCGTDN